ncbi:hypothetical protein M404DRAFT_637939 [Pisolithus tinctorius Marx 270]|uniref:Uncharacterized protein n=1 Tax=Pisolithus tinctorius Marx 270 TaxID=870435 RepID=A0A0C3JZZ5_PISTI|nr:hypothetical protein M404DRAFT_637939 [Pisolithus tinctorius Marx 270]
MCVCHFSNNRVSLSVALSSASSISIPSSRSSSTAAKFNASAFVSSTITGTTQFLISDSHISRSEPNMSCVTLIEELLFSCSDCSVVVSHGDTIPMYT